MGTAPLNPYLWALPSQGNEKTPGALGYYLQFSNRSYLRRFCDYGFGIRVGGKALPAMDRIGFPSQSRAMVGAMGILEPKDLVDLSLLSGTARMLRMAVRPVPVLLEF